MQEKLREPFRWRRSNVRASKDSVQICDPPRWPVANIGSLVIRVDSFLLEIQHNGASNLQIDRQDKEFIRRVPLFGWRSLKQFSLSPSSSSKKRNGKETMRVCIWRVSVTQLSVDVSSNERGQLFFQ